MFDDIFDIPSSNYLLEGREPVDGFATITPLWTTQQLIAAIYNQLNSSTPELEILIQVLLYFLTHRELLYSTDLQVNGNEGQQKDVSLETTFIQLMNVPNQENRVKLLTMLCLHLSNGLNGDGNFLPEDYLKLIQDKLSADNDLYINAIIFSEFLGKGCRQTLKFLKHRWVCENSWPEAEATLIELIQKQIPMSDENVTNLFCNCINTPGGMNLLFQCHDHITPQQMTYLADLVLRLWKGYFRRSAPPPENLFQPFFETTHTCCLRREAFDPEVMEETTFIPSFFIKCLKYYDVTVWNTVSPTFMAFLKKAISRRKPWLFFKTLREEALGQLASRNNGGLSLSDLDSSTKCSLAVLNKFSLFFSEKKTQGLSLKFFHQLFRLTLCCYGQAVYGEKLFKDKFSEPFAQHIGKKKLLSPQDHIPVSMFSSLISDHKTVNDLIADNRNTLPEAARIRFYYLNKTCPSPSLLYLALEDLSSPDSVKVALEAHKLIKSNIPSFSRMASLMLARAKGRDLKNILTYLASYNGAQITAILDPYISEYIKNEPAAFGKFILETLNWNLFKRVMEIIQSTGEVPAKPIRKYLTLMNKLKL